METLTGLLTFDSGEFSVNGTLLTLAGGTPDDAARLLVGDGFDSGDCVKLSGRNGTIGVNVPAFLVSVIARCA